MPGETTILAILLVVQYASVSLLSLDPEVQILKDRRHRYVPQYAGRCMAREHIEKKKTLHRAGAAAAINLKTTAPSEAKTDRGLCSIDPGEITEQLVAS
jgi:hypothetical protein